MLSRVLVSALVFVLALAKPVRRAEGITVALSAPADVSSLDELKLTATVANTGAEEVRILKYNTILDSEIPTRSFYVNKEGAAVGFTGISLSVSLDDLDESAYITLAAGEEKSFIHDVSALFDFETAGAGAYTFEPLTNFVVEDESAEEIGFARTTLAAPTSTVTVNISGDLAKRELVDRDVEKRAVLQCSSSSQGSFISASYNEAKSLASLSSSYISSRGTGDSLYRAYWGANSASTISNVFSRVAAESGSRILSCSDPYGVCTGGVIAYTVIATTNIYYCSIFYNEVTTSRLCSGTTVASRNIRGGTTLHELTHAVSGTDDVTYGCAADQALSDSNKRINADNYNCFATQVYANTQC